jgi:hypothetical protein
MIDPAASVVVREHFRQTSINGAGNRWVDFVNPGAPRPIAASSTAVNRPSRLEEAKVSLHPSIGTGTTVVSAPAPPALPSVRKYNAFRTAAEAAVSSGDASGLVKWMRTPIQDVSRIIGRGREVPEILFRVPHQAFYKIWHH